MDWLFFARVNFTKDEKYMVQPIEKEIYCTEYVHHWTKKLMRASDYGYKCWHFKRK